MQKTTYVFLFLAIIVCLSLLVGCTSPNATGTSSTPPTQYTTTVSPPVNATTQPPPSAPIQNSPSSVPSANASSNTSQNVTVSLPSFADLLDVAEHSVVKIDVVGTGTNSRGRTVQQQGAGSGWIMDSNGSIVTNNHVIEGATTITVTTLDGKTFPAQVTNADPVTDLALLKISASQLPSFKVGDASKLRVGDWVLAIGNPLGEGIIATQGIVSRLGVDVQVTSTQTYNDLIETTAPINPGNSGGPLINLAGEVVGITSLGVAASGIQGMGYAISMVDALPVIQKLSSK